MRIRRFRVQNYKSCRGSEYCWLAKDVTVLAGKNESGKTAILEGFSRIYNGDESALEDRTMGSTEEPFVDLELSLSENEIATLCSEAEVAIKDPGINNIIEHGLLVRKQIKAFYLFKSVTDLISNAPSVPSMTPAEMTDAVKQLSAITEPLGAPRPSDEDLSKTRVASAKSFAEAAENALANASESDRSAASDLLRRLKEALEAPDKYPHPYSRFLSALVKRMPKVLFFSDFDDLIDFETPFADAITNRAIQNLASIADLDLQSVANEKNIQRRLNMLNQKSAEITNTFGTSWLQESIRIDFSSNADNLLVSIQDADGTNLYAVRQRSKGFQWFLSFFARLQGQPLENTVVLIDEPGLYLHATAQRDVLNTLTKLGAKSQVVISTHSPYLIDKTRLDRVRLVFRDEQSGTTIQNKIHKDADAETLTPVVTAIGLDLGAAFSIAADDNVLTEGQSDAYILRAFANITNDAAFSKLHIVSCVGASRIPNVAALLKGWDLRYAAIFDRDNEGRANFETLNSEYVDQASPCVYVSADEGQSIEDLFSKEDFAKYFMDRELTAAEERTANSKLVKHAVDKVLKSKQLFEMTLGDEMPSVSEETKAAFTDLLSRVKAALAAQAESPR